MTVGILRETFPGERRVAVIPAGAATLKKAGITVIVESGAGAEAGFPDDQYVAQGAQIGSSRAAVIGQADCLLQVRTPGANPVTGRDDAEALRPGQVVIGMADPLGTPEAADYIASKGVTSFALELIPRITRAQSMDVLSSMATIAGYKAVLLAASTMPRMCPMMMTAAGTIQAAHAFVIGAGVAGLQAIASARRMGAKVEAYDVRPAVKEQIQSLGARFVELPLESTGAEDKGGYAKAQDEAFYRKQRELMAKSVAAADMVITTAAIPGKKSPVLITADAVKGMRPGSVIVDLAAERGGNCELTKADETVVVHGVTIFGPTNLPATVPYHASQMYSKNILTFFQSLLKDGALTVNLEDEVCRDTLITRDGQVVNERIKGLLAAAH
jgi:H+-translocating NAD(P) transhydrogenase subunit alpha